LFRIQGSGINEYIPWTPPIMAPELARSQENKIYAWLQNNDLESFSSYCTTRVAAQHMPQAGEAVSWLHIQKGGLP
jgi:hypothetical protein